jgi:hypothetical protein
MPGSRIAGSYGSCSFSFLRKLHANFQNDFTNLHFYQQCIGFLSPPCSYQHLLFVVLMITILTGVTWNLSIVFICISFSLRILSSSPCICHLYFFFFWELSIRLIHPFISWIVCSFGV